MRCRSERYSRSICNRSGDATITLSEDPATFGLEQLRSMACYFGNALVKRLPMRKKQGVIRALAVRAVEIADMAEDLVGRAAKSGAAFAADTLARSRTSKAKAKRSPNHRAADGVSSPLPKRRGRNKTRRAR